ncbi:hypothetical protein WALSEDRAFT_59153 [Wallemia mellicola CBS 633.66]|uniref:Uncharacterized protein n=1 Tax=Wallemia mellicola (strain ATCC MYA-4683 / CBS 633.66) TaxID=671144 RepID=I4YJS9_WALMC|nr:hypothetical protein WALSEDRAFT_59153 [Wallemia mellicola CBS 633.66]EIM24221.1 hypothetical protein WALSEDRAFT_59153 [Wallemia mellicola CBS 633.66]|eukprot:XP_006956039.1 hypothetical protein WALSEDRAFT_59153 [Wallemia mellicola CBS 633.66]
MQLEYNPHASVVQAHLSHTVAHRRPSVGEHGEGKSPKRPTIDTHMANKPSEHIQRRESQINTAAMVAYLSNGFL